jgi:hypothetical protein
MDGNILTEMVGIQNTVDPKIKHYEMVGECFVEGQTPDRVTKGS